MIERDRDLLARLGRANDAVAPATVELLDNLDDDGRLPADGLRALGDNLRHVADACHHRADEIDAERATVDVLDDQAERAL